MKKIFALLFAASVATAGWAQGAPAESKVVGKLADVRGLVTVGSGDRLTNAVSGAPLVAGSRIITTASGGVSLVYDNGCHIALLPNESFTVKEDCNCGELLASVQEVGTGRRVARANVVLSPDADAKLLGKLQGVEGLVTVGDIDRSVNALNGAPLILDNRIVTSSSGGVTLAYDSGCHIRLKGSETFTVKRNANCCALVALVQPVSGLLVASAPSAQAIGSISTPLLLGGGAAGLGLILTQQGQTQLSPN